MSISMGAQANYPSLGLMNPSNSIRSSLVAPQTNNTQTSTTAVPGANTATPFTGAFNYLQNQLTPLSSQTNVPGNNAFQAPNNTSNNTSTSGNSLVANSPQPALGGAIATPAQAVALATPPPASTLATPSSSPAPVPHIESAAPVPTTQTQPQGAYGQAINNLNTQSTNPVPSVLTAQSGLQSIANGGGTNAPAISSNIGILGNIAQNQSPAVQQAIKNVQGLQQAQSSMASDPNVAAEVASGRGQVIGNEINAGETALANTLAGQSQQITAANEAGNIATTGQGQQITAGQTAGNLGLNQQGQQITAAQNAGSLAQPKQQGYVLIDPTTGQPIGGQGGAMGAAFRGGQIGAAETAGGNTFLMNQANTAAKGIQGTIQQFIQSNPQLNSSTSTIANAAQQWLQGKQLGDPAYQTLFNYLNEYISTLAPILGVGGDTTNLKTQIAQSFINARASGQSISQVLNSIGTLADNKLLNLQSSGQGGGQVAGATQQGSAPTSFGMEW